MESSKTANHLVKIQCLQRASTNALPPIAAFLIADFGKTHEENVKTLKESMLWLQHSYQIMLEPTIFRSVNRYGFNY